MLTNPLNLHAVTAALPVFSTGGNLCGSRRSSYSDHVNFSVLHRPLPQKANGNIIGGTVDGVNMTTDSTLYKYGYWQVSVNVLVQAVIAVVTKK